MGPYKKTKESLETAQTVLEAESLEVTRTSHQLNDNLVEANRGIWRQLLFIWVIVIVLGISYLTVRGYMPISSNLAHEESSVQPNPRVQMDTAELQQASRSPVTAFPEREHLLNLLDQIRDAHYKKDIQSFLKAYARTSPGLAKKREQTLKIWGRYDYLDLQYQITNVQQKDAATIIGVVTWNFKTRDRKSNEIKTFSKTYQVKFSKESGEWLIQEIEGEETQGTVRCQAKFLFCGLLRPQILHNSCG
jgi:hypothetical protein